MSESIKATGGLIEPMDICKEFGECRRLPFGTEVFLTTDIIICKHCEKETYSCDCD